jgi:D-alanyl-lipoteichoic acid acyltransferase DltB (MBOAT superfamily)
VDFIFANYQDFNGGTLLLGALGFTFQIYGDFCGYSLIAIGVAKIMGFDLMRNFDTPYFSTSIQDFWRRWHISLSSFFRDYVYIPLGGGRVREWKVKRNLVTTFFVSGIWHGANWTFMVWGLIHGLLLVFQRAQNIRITKCLGWLLTMTMVVILWILFRSESITDFYLYVTEIILNPGAPEARRSQVVFFVYIILLDVVLLRYKEQGRTWFDSNFLEASTLALMLILVVGTINTPATNFIYFQF